MAPERGNASCPTARQRPISLGSLICNGTSPRSTALALLISRAPSKIARAWATRASHGGTTSSSICATSTISTFRNADPGSAVPTRWAYQTTSKSTLIPSSVVDKSRCILKHTGRRVGSGSGREEEVGCRGEEEMAEMGNFPMRRLRLATSQRENTSYKNIRFTAGLAENGAGRQNRRCNRSDSGEASV